MSKSKFSKKDLQQVKQGFKKEKITQVTEENGKMPSKDEQLQIARSAGRNAQIQNTGLTPEQLKRAEQNLLENIKKDFSDTHKVTASYGFEPGNLVHFKYRSKEEIGIVFKINKHNGASLASETMSLDEVEILSSAGYIKVQAKSIYEIIECN